jgi:hypothetical protein
MSAVIFGEPIPDRQRDPNVAYYCAGCTKPVSAREAHRLHCPHCGYRADGPMSATASDVAMNKCELEIENTRMERDYHQEEADRLDQKMADLEAELADMRRVR